MIAESGAPKEQDQLLGVMGENAASSSLSGATRLPGTPVHTGGNL